MYKIKFQLCGGPSNNVNQTKIPTVILESNSIDALCKRIESTVNSFTFRLRQAYKKDENRVYTSVIND